eukprot:GILK01011216.1.p1 GENE.GILK01011216.1~~GILK01011216.1.p1  ORF type:complete len:206 (-),score=23.78 GILK01011216.1:234-851(-)
MASVPTLSVADTTVAMSLTATTMPSSMGAAPASVATMSTAQLATATASLAETPAPGIQVPLQQATALPSTVAPMLPQATSTITRLTHLPASAVPMLTPGLRNDPVSPAILMTIAMRLSEEEERLNALEKKVQADEEKTERRALRIKVQERNHKAEMAKRSQDARVREEKILQQVNLLKQREMTLSRRSSTLKVLQRSFSECMRLS